MAKVLAADDSSALRMLARALLEGAGHDVVIAEDGEQVIAALQEEPFDLMILDIGMPRMDGYEVLREMRRTGLAPNTRVLMLTARNREVDWLKAYRQGADHFLPKPFEPEDLTGAVERLLAMTADQTAQHRQKEMGRAELLARLEATFA